MQFSIISLFFLITSIYSPYPGDFRTQIDRGEYLLAPTDAAFNKSGEFAVADLESLSVHLFSPKSVHLFNWQFDSPANRPCRVIESESGWWAIDKGNKLWFLSTSNKFPKMYLEKVIDVVEVNKKTLIILKKNNKVEICTVKNNIPVVTKELKIVGLNKLDEKINFDRLLKINDNLIAFLDINLSKVIIINKKSEKIWAFKKEWGIEGSHPGMLMSPNDFCFFNDQIVISDTKNHRISSWTTNGELIWTWGKHAKRPHQGDGYLHYPSSLCFSIDGSKLLIVEEFERRIQIFDTNINPKDLWTRQQRIEGAHFSPFINAVDDLLVVSEPELHKVHAFRVNDSSPVLLGSWGRGGNSRDSIHEIVGIDLIKKYNLRPEVTLFKKNIPMIHDFYLQWPSDISRAKYDPFIAQMKSACILDQFDKINSVSRVGTDGYMIVTVGEKQKLICYKQENENNFIETKYEKSLSSYFEPSSFAITKDKKSIYLLDQITWSCWKGALSEDSNESEIKFVKLPISNLLKIPWGIFLGSNNELIISDRGHDQVLIFKNDKDSFPKRFGTTGNDPKGELNQPSGIAQIKTNEFVVVDWGNHRLQSFNKQGKWMMTFGLGRTWKSKEKSDEAIDFSPNNNKEVMHPLFADAWLTSDGNYSIDLELQNGCQWSVGELIEVKIILNCKNVGFSFENLDLDIDVVMPHHGHGMNIKPIIFNQGNGVFLVDSLLLHMPGKWEVLVDIFPEGRNSGCSTRATKYIELKR